MEYIKVIKKTHKYYILNVFWRCSMWILDMQALTDWAIECFKNGDARKGKAIAKAHEHMAVAKYGRT